MKMMSVREPQLLFVGTLRTAVYPWNQNEWTAVLAAAVIRGVLRLSRAQMANESLREMIRQYGSKLGLWGLFALH